MTEPHRPRVYVVEDAEAVANVAAETVVDAIKTAAGRRGRCVVALSGGSTPARLYALLASSAYDAPVPWPAVDLVWGDERAVPPDDAASNYRMADESGLLRRSLHGVYRIPGERDPEEAALLYEETLRQVLGGPPEAAAGDAGPLDLALLGLGEDGHTASLFPGSIVLEEKDRLVRATEEQAGHRRLTLTVPLLAGARHVVFLVAGAGKAPALAQVLDPAGDAPAARVIRRAERVTVLADRAAAARLS